MVFIKELKVLSLFSGIGAFEKALKRAKVPMKLVAFAEIDKYAIKSYCTIHNESAEKNLGDVSVVDYSTIEDVDLVVGGSPCQDFSVAGKQNGSVWTCKDCGEQYNPIQQHYSLRGRCIKCGSENLEKTRSSLLVEYLRAIREKKPKYFVYENVKNIVGKQFKEIFNLFKGELEEYGYNVSYEVLNSKMYGVPQNRERVFVVGIRKDIDNGDFIFPKGFDNGIRLKDILDEKIDEKYYLSKDVQSRFKFSDKKQDNIIGTTKPDFRTIGQRDLVYGIDGVMGCLVATDYKQPKQIIEGIVINHDCIRIRKDGIGTCLDAHYGMGIDNHGARTGVINVDLESDFRIRKLTPTECFSLMGFEKSDAEKCSLVGISDTQLYKQAGNSIVVDVLYYIFKNLLSNYINNN